LEDSWLKRPLVVGALLFALLALVVLAAHGHIATGGTHGGQLSGGIVDTLVSALLALYALGAIGLFGALVWSRGAYTRQQVAGGRRRTYTGIALALVLLSLLLASGDRLRGRLHLRPQAHSTQAATGGGASKSKHHRHTAAAHHSRFRLAPFLVVFLGLGVAAFALYRQSKSRRPPREPLPAVVAEELGQTLEELRAESDPRRAVIAAYARMERLLGESGLPRRPFEAPLEYMSRVLVELGGGTRSVRALTRLFERARFSPHAIDAAMKDEAVAAVEALQADLERAEAEVAA
jgi:hypothetical protein